MSLTRAVNPVLAALAEAAVAATGASQGWLLAVDGELLRVEAVAGQGEAAGIAGATVPAGSGSAGYVAASGHRRAGTRACCGPPHASCDGWVVVRW